MITNGHRLSSLVLLTNIHRGHDCTVVSTIEIVSNTRPKAVFEFVEFYLVHYEELL
jgi:hypothetical protein